MKSRKPADPNGLVHALLYTRVCGAEHQQLGLSLDAQTSATRAYAANHTGWIVAGEFQDVMSARRDDRPQYQDMLNEARHLAAIRARVAVVVVRADRLGRDVAEAARARKELTRLGAQIHMIADGGMVGDLPGHSYMAVAQDESKRIGERVAAVRSNLVQSGWYYGRTAFGFRARPLNAAEQALRAPSARQRSDRWCASMIEPDPVTSGVAIEVFQRVADGASVHSTARWLAAQSPATRGGRSWGHQSFVAMLRSPTYIARPAEGAEDVLTRPVSRWEPLISDELWVRVQERMAAHASRGRYASGQYLLTGFVRCARCGSRMGATKRGGDGARTYRCLGVAIGAKAPLANCQYGIPMTIADRAVLDKLSETLQSLSDAKRWPSLLDAWRCQQSGPKSADPNARRLVELDRDLARANERLGRAADLLLDPKRPDAEANWRVYEVVRDREMSAIDAIQAARAGLGAMDSTKSARRIQKLPPLDQLLREAGGWGEILVGADIADQRAVLESLVATVRMKRVGWGKYEADLSWTTLGGQLAGLAGVLMSPVQQEDEDPAA